MPSRRFFLPAALLIVAVFCGLLLADGAADDPDQYPIILARIVNSPNATEANQITACDKLQELGPRAAIAAPALVRALRHENPLKTHAAVALEAIGAAAIPALRAAMNVEDRESLSCTGLTWAAIEVNRGTTADALYRQVARGEVIERYMAVLALARSQPPADVIPMLVRANALDPSELVRHAANIALILAQSHLAAVANSGPPPTFEDWPPVLGAFAQKPVVARDRLAGPKVPDDLPRQILWSRDYLRKLVRLAQSGSNGDRIAALKELARYRSAADEFAGDVRKLLDDPSADICRAASDTLFAIGQPAIPQWLDALQSRDGYTRRLALTALADPWLNEFVDRKILLKHLSNALDYADPLIRRPAARGLCALWPQSEPLLTAAMKAGDEAVRVEVIAELVETYGDLSALRAGTPSKTLKPGPDSAPDETFADFEAQVLPELLRRTNSPLERERENALDAMMEFRSEKSQSQIAAALLKELESQSPVYHNAERRLSALGSKAVPTLLIGARSHDAFARKFCVKALVERSRSTNDEKITAALTVALRDASDEIRKIALGWVLSRPDSVPVPGTVEMMVDLTKPPIDVDTGAAVAAALGRFAVKPGVSVPALIRLMNIANRPDIEVVAIRAIARFGADAKPALPRLTELLKADNVELARAAATALPALGPDGSRVAVAFLIDKLRHKLDEDGREWALASLAAMGPQSADAVPDLTPLLADTDNDLRLKVVRALGAIGPAARPAFPALTRMMDNRNPDVREAACDALVKISDAGKGLGPALLAAVVNRDRSCADRLAAVMQHSADAPRTLTRLTDLADNDPDTAVRATARRAAEFLSINAAPAGATRPG